MTLLPNYPNFKLYNNIDHDSITQSFKLYNNIDHDSITQTSNYTITLIMTLLPKLQTIQ